MALDQVRIESGIVEGYPAGNQFITVFKGIPFAKPPVGEFRWRAPQPAEPWEGVYKAYKFGNIAMQPRFVSEGGGTSLAAQEFYVRDYPMSEDCLYLNIWTPAETGEEKLPVAVYCHGGGYETGYSYLNAYDGEGFAKRGIVLVTVAYRVNVFGFLSHPELAAEDPHGSSGNYGLMDLICAVEWIRRNIAAFGGDPENISLFGQSAGGGCVQNMIASPLMKGKIRRAIMQSSGGISRDDFGACRTREADEEIGKRFFEFLGVKDVSEARAVDARTIEEKYKEFKKSDFYGMIFIPDVDGYVLPEAPADYFQAGKHDDIEYMVGCTRDEMRRFGAPAPSYETLKQDAARFGSYAETYLARIHADDPEKVQPCFEDPIGNSFLAAALAFCENQNDLGYKPAHMYYFTYVPPGAEAMGAHHSVEHHYVFQTLMRSRRAYTGFDFDLSNELADYWANFIKTGDPNPAGTDRWKPYTEEAPEALIIDRERAMGEVPRLPIVQFQLEYSLGKLDARKS